jgi:hypothetical protein
MKKHLIVMAVIGLVAVSCLKDKTVEPIVLPVGPCADTVSFESEIMNQVFNVSCNTAGCHDSGSAAAGYTLLTHDQISSNSEILVNVLNHNAGVVPMPLGSPTTLADSLLQKFNCWIEQGKLDN